MCGLKLFLSDQARVFSMSHPSRVCGLKYPLCVISEDRKRRTFAGVWIEIGLELSKSKSRSVAPSQCVD